MRGSTTPLTQRERLKYEVAGELGLLEKMLNVGWGGLSAEETGRIGGIVAHRLRELYAGETDG